LWEALSHSRGGLNTAGQHGPEFQNKLMNTQIRKCSGITWRVTGEQQPVRRICRASRMDEKELNKDSGGEMERGGRGRNVKKNEFAGFGDMAVRLERKAMHTKKHRAIVL
jgi:hypothetical protein